MSKAELDRAAKEWLAARRVIAAAVREWWPGSPAEDYAAAILARLASHEPPILTTFAEEDGARPKSEQPVGASPAPWCVGVSPGGGWPTFRLRDMNDPKDAAEVEADRRLMEAAPGLLAACEEALPELEATAEAYGGRNDPLWALIAHVKAAVAKARKP